MRIRRMEDQTHLFASTVSIRDLEVQIYLLTSRITQLTSQICKVWSSQTIINIEENESAITLTSNEELQVIQEKESKDTGENEKIKP